MINETEYRQMLNTSDTSQYNGVDIRNPKVQVVNEDTAILVYSTQMKGLDMLHVSTWVKENGNWVCVFHSENPQSLTLHQMK